MTKHRDRRHLPIGVFDSGVGGLTVLRAVRRLLPRERYLYFGDTARVPYGTKSPETVRRYCEEIARFLRREGVKVLVVACNTASSVALPIIRRAMGVPVLGVVAPGAMAALEATRTRRVGIIGTAATVASRSYERALRKRDPRVTTFARACPLFVPLAEEGCGAKPETVAIARRYLEPLRHKNVDALILGCTHYPLLRAAIARVMGPRVTLVDSASAVALALRALLERKNLSAPPAPFREPPEIRTFVTDDPARFRLVADRFLGRSLREVRRIRFPFQAA